MPLKSAFTFVLHTHLPYVRRAGGWPHGEEMLHEAIADTYVPLLDALTDLAESGCQYRLAIGITPILAEQLADADVVANFRTYMRALLPSGEQAAKDYERRGLLDLARVAAWHVERQREVLRSFDHRYGGDLPGAFRRLQDGGYVELVGGAATHAFLPLMARDSTIHAQLTTGVQAHRRHFGRAPASFWLPECGYRPAYYDLAGGAATFRPGLETHLQRLGIRAFFADSSAVRGVPAAASNGLYGSGDAEMAEPLSGEHKSTAWPYLVSDSSVAVFGRDELTSRQVWSARAGYPGHFAYREFHKKDPRSGLRLWRVSGREVDLADKAVYDPEQAFSDVAAHVEHFVSILEHHLGASAADGQAPPIVVAPYDTELFGHWWFEGIAWLTGVLRRLADHPDIELTTPAAYLDRYAPAERIALPESSWGAGGDARTWANWRTNWMWPIVHHYERQMERLAAQYAQPDGERPALAQLVRELLLLQGSDWPFLISTGQAPEYASERFRTHAARFDRLAEALFAGEDAGAEAAAQRIVDNPFPDIDARLFSPAGWPSPPAA